MLVYVVQKIGALLSAGVAFLIGLYFTTNWGRLTPQEILVGFGVIFVGVCFLFGLWRGLTFRSMFKLSFLNEVFFWTAIYLLAVLAVPDYPLLAISIVVIALVFVRSLFSWVQRREKSAKEQ